MLYMIAFSSSTILYRGLTVCKAISGGGYLRCYVYKEEEYSAIKKNAL